VVLLLVEKNRSTLAAVAAEHPGAVVEGLCAGETELEIDDGGLLVDGGRRCGLGMTGRGVHSLMHEVGDEIGLEGCGIVKGLNGFTAIEHDRAQESKIGGRERTPIDGDGLAAGYWVREDGAAVGIVCGGDGELSAGGEREGNANQAAFEEKAVVGRIAREAVGAVGAIHRREQGILPVGFGIGGADTADAEAHGIAGEVAGGTRTTVRAQTLEEGIGLVDRASGVKGRDEAGRITERKQVGDSHGRNNGGQA